MDNDPIVGHKTSQNEDGSFRHEPLRKEEADAILKEAERLEAERAEQMPDEQAAIRQMWNAYQRLKVEEGPKL